MRRTLKPRPCRLLSERFASSRVAAFSLFVHRIDMEGNESRRYGRFYRTRRAERRAFASASKYESPGVPSCARETGIYERYRVIDILRLGLMYLSLCQLLPF